MKSKLFTPYTIKNVYLKNRIVMSPMCMYSSLSEDGKVHEFHSTHYASRALGQVGLIVIEATAVTAQGRISPRDLGIWDDKHIDGLKKLVNLVHNQDAKIGIQLAHAGRKAEIDGEIIAPSPLPFNEKMKKPTEMTIGQIQETVKAFKEAAIRAKKAGFDIIELHGAHGYLINEFLSPLTNKRTDEYGGSAENRYRFLREIVDDIKSIWDGPLFIRVSATDHHPDGLTIEDYINFSKIMKEQGVDLIDCSSGAVVPAKIDVFPGYQVQYSDKIRNDTNIPTAAVGFITTALQAEEILKNERADLVFLGRELLRNPFWPYTAAKELNDPSIQIPIQYISGWKL